MSLSCTSGRLDNTAAGNLEMSFTAAELTRASVTTDLNTEGSGFAVYGDMKFENDDERIPPSIIFSGTKVTYNGSSWSYTGTQYWFPRHEHSFVAVHPADAAGISDTRYSDSELSFTYTLPDDYTEAHDLLAAAHRRKVPSESEDNPPYSAAPVGFKFFHVMSRVDFKVTNDKAADNVRVTNITLEGVNKTGTFSIAPAPLLSGSEQTDDYISGSDDPDSRFLWGDISNEGTLTADIRVDIPEDEDCHLFPDDNALFVIPQPENNSVIMRITYTLIDAGADDEELTLTAETPIGGWEYGKVYTYSFAVSEITKEIELTVSVKAWHPEKTDGITVPEY